LIFKILQTHMAKKTRILLVTLNLAKTCPSDSKIEIALGLADLWHFDKHMLDTGTMVMGPLLILPRSIYIICVG